MSLSKTNTNNNYRKPTRVNNMFGAGKKPGKPKKKKKSEDRIVRDIKNFVNTKKNVITKQ